MTPLTDVVIIFEVHQPYRIKKDFFWEHRRFSKQQKNELFPYYFDQKLDREIFERAYTKCYRPANAILLQLIDEYKREKKRVKVSFSLSGVFLEQCERYKPDLLESFQQLGQTGCVEYLDQTYYHSLVGLYPDRAEFIDEVKLHRQVMKELLNAEPAVLENTELLYNNAIAKVAEDLGYSGIVTEGVERILNGRSPNYVYRAKNTAKIGVLLRNFKLTDDIGFRFSQRSWEEWPLTAEKYANWIAATPGQCIVIFPDYETFGEHHWPETGIHEFLRHLPGELLKKEQLQMVTPSEALKSGKTSGEIDVPELGGTVSWADTARDASCWIGNTMQWAYYVTARNLEPYIKEADDEALWTMWRDLLISDHLYYMFNAGGAAGEVHSYFSPYESPQNAAITIQSALVDFESRVKLYVVAANEPFLFNTGSGDNHFTGTKAWSLKGFVDAVTKVDLRSLEFHNKQKDFEAWAALSLRDETLAQKFKEIRVSKITGQRLRDQVHRMADARFWELNRTIHDATQWF